MNQRVHLTLQGRVFAVHNESLKYDYSHNDSFFLYPRAVRTDCLP